ncbi:putative metal-dependent membrane protease [Desulfosporosinus acidiphilus SJ4]|uniref:Putative metal-dependent membrane protease n=1 Tax=Desulfosporosinus acidiphilus (strain DSM 22704 / JCM 16185 / SJ4) TaxID=646529 RepID=I4D4S8_DESAJ|nr:type II CAAX endopeptidase family protein [Desulfosporosinus acidiphilus]AFM40802.1 putative metal-dependent membrane protease [Desulfosporosinus acidiphilus SJ4]
MDGENEHHEVIEFHEYPEPQRNRTLNWVDLLTVLGGIIVIYIVLALGTLWLMKIWPNERVLMYLNAFLTQFSFILLILLLKVVRHWKWSDFGWRSVPLRKILPNIVKTYAITWVLNIGYVIFLYKQGMSPPTTDVYTKLLGQSSGVALILNLLLAGVLAPLVEETMFRGLIYGSLRTYCGKWTAAVISAAIFSGLHFQAYGFIPRFVLGIALVYLFDKYKSLYPNVALHSLNNVVATLIAAKFTG